MDDLVAAPDDIPPDDGKRSDPMDKDIDDDDDERIVERDPTGRYGRYDIVLGKGAFKTVYKAFDEVDGIEVAWNQVKVQDVFKSEDELERLYAEVNLLKTLKHKNIIKFYNSWVDTKTKNVNFITEIFTSGTLRQYRKKHKHCDMKAVKNWSRQILRGLLYLHSHDPPIIHRDLKCDNIFVNGNQGEVKIGDLGLAAILHHKDAAHSVIGTPEFMAPEFYEEEYNELVDIYAFGMCVLEMVTLEYPYSECQNAAQIYKKVMAGKKPAALEKVKDPEVRTFVEKCLVSASRRLPARELLADPFLKEPEKDQSDGMSSRVNDDRKHDTSVLYVASKEDHDRFLQASPRSASRRVSEDAVDPKAGDSRRGPVDHRKERLMQEDQDKTERIERARSSRDFKVRGKLDDDEQTVYLRVKIADAAGHVRQIHFPFNIREDTAFCVASEMVEELDLSNQDVTDIADMIDAEIMKLVPDWKPGPAFEESTEASEKGTEGGVDKGEVDSGQAATGLASQEGSVSKGNSSSHSNRLTKARSLSPPSSIPRYVRKAVEWGRAASPMRIGAASPLLPAEVEVTGVAHGRFWEGVAFRDLPWTPNGACGFSSEDSDSGSGEQHGSPGKKGGKALKDGDKTRDGEKKEGGRKSSGKKGEGEEGRQRSEGRKGPSQEAGRGGSPSPPQASAQWAKEKDAAGKHLPEDWLNSPDAARTGNRYTMTDFTKLMKQQGGGSGSSSSYRLDPSVLHSQSDLDVTARQGLWGSTEQLQPRRSSSGFLDDEGEEGEEDDEAELFREEEELRLQREAEMQELELRFWQRLMELRSRHRRKEREGGGGEGGREGPPPGRRGEQGRDKYGYKGDREGDYEMGHAQGGGAYGAHAHVVTSRSVSGQLGHAAEGSRRAGESQRGKVPDWSEGGGGDYGRGWREERPREELIRGGEVESKGRTSTTRDTEWEGHGGYHAGEGWRREGRHGTDYRDREWDRERERERDYRERNVGGDRSRPEWEGGRDRGRGRDVERNRDWERGPLPPSGWSREWSRDRDGGRDFGGRADREWERIGHRRDWEREGDRSTRNRRGDMREWHPADRDWERGERGERGERERGERGERGRDWGREHEWAGGDRGGNWRGDEPYRGYWDRDREEWEGRGEGPYRAGGPPPSSRGGGSRFPPVPWDGHSDRGSRTDLVQDPEMRRRAEDRARGSSGAPAASSSSASGGVPPGFYGYGSGEAPFQGVAPHRFDAPKREGRGREEGGRKGGESGSDRAHSRQPLGSDDGRFEEHSRSSDSHSAGGDGPGEERGQSMPRGAREPGASHGAGRLKKAVLEEQGGEGPLHHSRSGRGEKRISSPEEGAGHAHIRGEDRGVSAGRNAGYGGEGGGSIASSSAVHVADRLLEGQRRMGSGNLRKELDTALQAVEPGGSRSNSSRAAWSSSVATEGRASPGGASDSLGEPVPLAGASSFGARESAGGDKGVAAAEGQDAEAGEGDGSRGDASSRLRKVAGEEKAKAVGERKGSVDALSAEGTPGEGKGTTQEADLPAGQLTTPRRSVP